MNAFHTLGLLTLATAWVTCVAGCGHAPARPALDESLLLATTQPPGALCEALQESAATNRRDLAPRMLDHLASADAGVRACAHQALVALLGEDPVGYRAYDPPARRTERIEAWRSLLAVKEPGH